jgi:predicted HTH transcriptional regulator
MPIDITLLIDPAHDWTEEEIHTLIEQQQDEGPLLEYKAAAALEDRGDNRREISKDICAMANSDTGGTIIYGIAEQKKKGLSFELDPVDPEVISQECLAQVIDSLIRRQIPGLRIQQIDSVAKFRIGHLLT